MMKISGTAMVLAVLMSTAFAAIVLEECENSSEASGPAQPTAQAKPTPVVSPKKKPTPQATSNAEGCTPNPAGTSKDLGDGTFLDGITCLTWMKDEWHNKGALIRKDHAASCSKATIAGHTDWRGPDAGEMSSLIAKSGGCGSWTSPSKWNSLINNAGFNEPVMFWTATLGDGKGSDHQCAVNGNTGALEGGSRMNPYHVICVRGTSPVTGTVTTCEKTACDV